MAVLFSRHSSALGAAYGDLENHALAQRAAPSGTPGSVLERSNAGGFRYYARQTYDPSGRKVEAYLAGPIGEPAAEAAVAAARADVADAQAAQRSIRLLLREGYAGLSPKQYSVIAALANAGLFAAGAVMVGTHAFDSIANRLGIRTSSFATEDIDIARPARLALAREIPPGGLLEIIRGSGVDFVEVPGFDVRDPAVKFKERGRSRFLFEILVPTERGEPFSQPVPELRAHAIALPFLRYLVAESQPGLAMSRHGCAAVRLPLPERMAWHKALVAQLRTGRPEKSQRDLRQAATLLAALAESDAHSLAEAWKAVPSAAKTRIRKSMPAIAQLLVSHPEAAAAVAQVSG